MDFSPAVHLQSAPPRVEETTASRPHKRHLCATARPERTSSRDAAAMVVGVGAAVKKSKTMIEVMRIVAEWNVMVMGQMQVTAIAPVKMGELVEMEIVSMVMLIVVGVIMC
ncbi:Protein of unknown function [Gryllus bimaculatus]|nr:Protein of unknown function [Gryllus bimaculatus]